MNLIDIKPLLLAQVDIKKSGGAELFAKQLKYFFPKITILDLNKLENISKKEHVNVKKLWQYARNFHEFRDYDFIITMGIGSYPLEPLNALYVLNFHHGNWFGFRNYCYTPLHLKYHYINYFKLPYERRSIKHSINVVPSRFIKNILIQEGAGSDEASLKLLYNTSIMEVKKDVKKRDSILFVGRPTREKGFHIFLSIARYFKREKFIAVLTGTSEVKNRPENMGIYYNIPHDQLGNFYKRAKFLILPSCFEGNSYVILEAWKHDTPVIGSNVGLLWELEKFPGIKVYKSSSLPYIRAVKQLLNNGIKESPSKFFQNHYSPKIIEEMWMTLLGDLQK